MILRSIINNASYTAGYDRNQAEVLKFRRKSTGERLGILAPSSCGSGKDPSVSQMDPCRCCRTTVQIFRGFRSVALDKNFRTLAWRFTPAVSNETYQKKTDQAEKPSFANGLLSDPTTSDPTQKGGGRKKGWTDWTSSHLSSFIGTRK